MEKEQNKLEHFTATILRDADARSQKILEDVEKTRQARLREAETEIEARMERQIEADLAQVKSRTGQAISQKMMEDKRRLFEKRSQVAGKILADVCSKLEDWTKSGEYAGWLGQQLELAFGQLPAGEDAVFIQCRDQDEAILKKSLASCQRPWTLEPSAQIRLGGLRLECPESHLAIDCTLDSAAQETREHIAEYLGLRLE